MGSTIKKRGYKWLLAVTYQDGRHVETWYRTILSAMLDVPQEDVDVAICDKDLKVYFRQRFGEFKDWRTR